ncbi:hypothetical protein V8D89_007562 [Ganoderma adspersum]
MSFTILYFDFFLTLPAEVDRYWTGNGYSWASLLFFMNRYMSVFCHIPIIYEFFWSMPESRCRKLQLYHQLLVGVTQCVVGVLLTLRTYALYNRSRQVVGLLAAISAVGTGITVWAVLGAKGTYPNSHDVSRWVGCDLRVTQKQGYYVAAAWSSILIFDATVFGLTLWQALNVGRMWSHSLFHIILRDGTIYFWILAVCYTANIMTNIFAQPELKGILTTMTNVISTSLVSRMMLNIRNPDLLELPHRWPSEHWEL